MLTAASLTAGLGLITAAIGGAWTWWNNRNAALNTPAMQQAAENKQELAAEDQIAEDVQDNKIIPIREDLR